MRHCYTGACSALAGFGSHLHILVLLSHPLAHVRVISYSYPILKTVTAANLNYSQISYVRIRKGPQLQKGIIES